MSRRQKPKALHLSTVPPKPRQSRIMADRLTVQFQPIQWTPQRIQDVARLLADALIRDLQQYPIPESRKAS